MLQKRKVAIDIDDVIAGSTDALRILVNERTGNSLTADDYHKVGGEYWGYYERVWRAHDIGDEVSFKDFEAEMIIDQSHVPLLPGASFAIGELTKKFHVIFITARNKTWEQATRNWFERHFGKTDIELYFCESHKDSGAMTKGELCKSLGAHLLIDDSVSHCQSALDEGVEAILFGDYGWQGKVSKNLTRCGDWPAVLEYLEYDA